MRTSRTTIRRNRAGQLITDIPLFILPSIRRELARIWEPGKTRQTTTFIRLETGARDRYGRLPVFIPNYLLLYLGIDPTQSIEVRLYRYPFIWFESHLYHGYPSGRVFLPWTVVDLLNLKPNWAYSFQIRGQAPRIRIERMEEKREIVISHLNREYIVTSRTFVIPEVTGTFMGRIIEPESIFGWAIDQGFNVVAEWFYDEIPGTVYVDFLVDPRNPVMERSVAIHNNLAFRNMSVRNFSVEDITAYRFLTEIRATFLSAYPRTWYDAIDVNWQVELIEALNTTTYNLATYLLYIGESDNLVESRKPIKMTVDELKKGNRFPPRVREIITEGTEINTPIDGAKIEGKFFYANKYIRIVDSKDKYWEYATNEKVESLILQRNFSKKKSDIDLVNGANGFVWREKR